MAPLSRPACSNACCTFDYFSPIQQEKNKKRLRYLSPFCQHTHSNSKNSGFFSLDDKLFPWSNLWNSVR